MRKVFYLIIVGLSLPLFIQAQMLNMSSNLPRKGDRLIKHQVTLVKKDINRSGILAK